MAKFLMIVVLSVIVLVIVPQTSQAILPLVSAGADFVRSLGASLLYVPVIAFVILALSCFSAALGRK
jgi:hypothetical protein